MQEFKKKLPNFLEQVPDSFIIIDRNNIIQYSNNTLFHNIHDLIELGLSDFIELEYLDNLKKIISDVFKKGEIKKIEVKGKDQNKNIAWYECVITPIQDGEKITYVMIITRDITESKAREDLLKKMKYAIEQSMNGVAITDLDGFIQFVNPAWIRMHGYNKEDLIGRNLSVFHSEDQMPDVQRFIEEIIKNDSYQAELGHMKKDGTTFPTWHSGSYFKDEKGNPIGLLAITHDITDQITTKKKLLQLTSILENTSDFVSISSPDGHITYVNQAGADMIGLKVQHNSIPEIMISELHPKWAADIINNIGIPSAIQNGIWRGETAILLGDGREIPISQVIIAHFSSIGELEYLSTIIRDISESKKVEAELIRVKKQLRVLAMQ